MEYLPKLINTAFALTESLSGVLLSTFILLLMILWSGKRRRGGGVRINYGDLAAVIYVLVQCITLAVSKVRPNTLHFIVPYLFALNAYITVRLTAPYRFISTIILVRCLLVTALLLSAGDLIMQIQSIGAARRLFLPEALSSIRVALPLLGAPIRNDCLAIALSLLPYTYAAVVFSRNTTISHRIAGVLAASGLTAVLILGFSRSVYLALVLFVLSYLVIAVISGTKLRAAAMLLLLSASATATGAVYYTGAWRAVVQTSLLTGTVSQERSTTGRLAIWREMAPYAAHHAFLGVGGGNEGLLTLKRLQLHDAPFTAHPYNLILGTLLSSGLLGLLCYATLIGYPVFATVRRLRIVGLLSNYDKRLLILVAGIISTLLREMTYSSLLSCGAVIAISWTTLAILNNGTQLSGDSKKWNRDLYVHDLGWAVLAGLIILSVPILRTVRGDSLYNEGCNSLFTDETAQAHTNFSNAIRWNSTQPMYYAADALSLEREAFKGMSESERFAHPSSVSPSQRDLLTVAKHDLESALRLSSDDTALWADLGWVDKLMGDPVNSTAMFMQAIEHEPNAPMALISKAMGDDTETSTEEYAAAIVASPRLLDSAWFARLCLDSPQLASAVVQRAQYLLLSESTSPIRSASLGKLYMYQGDYKLARSELTRAVSDLPSLTYAWSNLAIINLKEHKQSIARDDLLRARFLDPENRIAVNMLAKIDYDSGDVDSAEGLYAQLLLLPDESTHADRVWRLYHVPPPLADDVIPRGMLTYISPAITAVKICDSLWLEGLEEHAGANADAIARIERQEELCKTS